MLEGDFDWRHRHGVRRRDRASRSARGSSWFGLRLDPDVYYIDRLPINVSGWDFLAVAISAMTICTLITILPARAASTVRPVDGLRFE